MWSPALSALANGFNISAATPSPHIVPSAFSSNGRTTPSLELIPKFRFSLPGLTNKRIPPAIAISQSPFLIP